MTTTELGTFEGADVSRAAIQITNAGDGLSEAVKVEPIVIHRGDTGYLVLEWECVEVRFTPADKENPHGDAVRVQKLKAGTATFVDAALVGELIAEQREKNLKAKEDAAGIQRLEFEDGDEDGDGDEDETETEPEEQATGLPPEPSSGSARDVLGLLTKTEMRELADKHGVIYTQHATALQLIKLLENIPGITDDASALVDAKQDTNVTELRPGGTDG